MLYLMKLIASALPRLEYRLARGHNRVKCLITKPLSGTFTTPLYRVTIPSPAWTVRAVFSTGRTGGPCGKLHCMSEQTANLENLQVSDDEYEEATARALHDEA